MFEPGKLYSPLGPIWFGSGDKFNIVRDVEIRINSGDCLLFLYEEADSLDNYRKWIHFYYDNKIIFRLTANTRHDYFEEIKDV